MEMNPVRAKDVMSSEVMSIAADATVFEAIALLVNSGVSAMPVLDPSGVMVGIVSEIDLIRCAEASASSFLSATPEDAGGNEVAATVRTHTRSRAVTEVMTRTVATADENATLREVAEVMLKHRVKRVPIVSGHSVTGIVSRIDLLRAQLSPSTPATAPKAPTEPQLRTDEDLRHDVVAALRGKPWSVARRADVVVNGGVAHLWGVVPNDAIRRAYQLAAEQVPGVSAAEVHMHVADGSVHRR
jgi:CBS domain-containing protein